MFVIICTYILQSMLLKAYTYQLSSLNHRPYIGRVLCDYYYCQNNSFPRHMCVCVCTILWYYDLKSKGMLFVSVAQHFCRFRVSKQFCYLFTSIMIAVCLASLMDVCTRLVPPSQRLDSWTWILGHLCRHTAHLAEVYQPHTGFCCPPHCSTLNTHRPLLLSCTHSRVAHKFWQK